MNYELDEEEQEILEAFRRGELKRMPNADEEIALAKLTARNTLKKSRRVTLRVTEHDFDMAHTRAMEEGIPYQTLLSSIIHKYLSGRLTDLGPSVVRETPRKLEKDDDSASFRYS